MFGTCPTSVSFRVGVGTRSPGPCVSVSVYCPKRECYSRCERSYVLYKGSVGFCVFYIGLTHDTSLSTHGFFSFLYPYLDRGAPVSLEPRCSTQRKDSRPRFLFSRCSVCLLVSTSTPPGDWKTWTTQTLDRGLGTL